MRRQQQQHARREPNGAALLHGGERKQLTEGQRTQVDAEAKQLLRELNAAVQRLSDTEQVRQSTELTIQLKKRARKRLGPVGRWAAGGAAAAVPASPEEELDRDRARAVKMHREGVIWYLQQKLQQCGQFQSTMMGIRLSREMERNKTTLYNVRGALPRPDSFVGSALPPAIEAGAGWESANGSNQAASRAALGADEADSKVAGEALSADQLQMLQQENTDLLKHYEDSLDRIR